MNARETLKINGKGHLEIGGADTVELAEKFGTPLYVFDEKYVRDMMSVYRETIGREYGGHGIVAYASKAFSCMAIYAIAADEKIGVDVVSGGELYTALKAGFPAEKIFMHGNNKLYSELEFALDNEVGTIVVDSYREADIIDELAPAWRLILTHSCRRRELTVNSVFPYRTARRKVSRNIFSLSKILI